MVHRDCVQRGGSGGDGMNLKPCPFCDSHDVSIMREGKSDKNAAYRVVCRNCKTRGPKVWVQPWHDTKFVAQGQAAAAWNKRLGRRKMP